MAKKENSGLKAGFTKDDTAQRKADTQRKAETQRQAEEKAALELARKQAEEAEQENQVVEAAEHSDEAGPTITMQGVSGKKITSTVKVVKVRKAANVQSEDAAETESPASSDATSDNRTDTVKAAPPSEEYVPASVNTAAASDAVVSEQAPAKVEVAPEVTEATSDKTKPLTAETAEKTAVSDVPVKTVKPAAPKKTAAKTAPAKAADKPKPKAETKAEDKKEESTPTIATPNTTVTLPSTTPQPRKIKSGSAVQAERAATAAEPKKLGNRRDELPKTGRPAPRSQGQAPGQRRPQDQTAAPQAGRREQTSAPRPAAAAADGKPSMTGPNAPNRGQGPTREAKPIGSLNRPITPGKVGNIFDKSTKSDKVDSSLAATAKAFAQRKERQAAQVNDDRTQRRGPGGPGGAPGGRPQRSGPPGQGGYRPQSEGFGDKDKDDDQKPQFRRKAPRKTTGDEFAPAVTPNRPGFAQRDAKDKSKKERDNRGGDRSRRGGFNDRSGFNDFRSPRGSRRHGGQNNNAPRQPVAVLTHVSLPEALTVKELAEALKKTSADVIKTLMGMGVLATLNQVVDYETATLIANEFKIETDLLIEETEEDILFDDSEDNPEDLVSRPPVVAVMGHVDHGKTSLLDYIRSAHVTTGEAGGITQHIGAYQVRLDDRKITFLDTPGHEAFTTMRARGAQATDIAILVVAADDGVMPQTVEAINHARAANTEIVVAINKIDKPGANIDKVKQELAQHNLITEDWGGTTTMVPVSAKTGEGIDTLLEMVLLTADILELKANPNRQAKGIVIEAKLDKNRGPLATMLVQRGSLSVGDTIVTGAIVGNIRAMADANQKSLKKAGPSVPVEIMGLPEVPEAGDIFYVVKDDRVARQLAEKRRDKMREDTMSPSSRMSLDNLYTKMAAGDVKELNLIVKADVQGSVEAVRQSLEKLNNEEVKVNIIHGAVGAVNETDIRLAEVSNAIIIAFNVRPPANVAEQAKSSGVDIRTYSVIYTAIDDIQAAMKGMLAPVYKEVVLGHAEVRETFKVSAIGTIAGGYVTDGKMVRNAKIRLLRDNVVIHEGQLASLRRFKDDVREVASGYECGFSIERFNDLKIGDVIEAFEMQEIERK